MSPENYFDVQHIVEVSTNNTDNIGDKINEYIQQHGYKLLHIGTVTDRNTDNGEVNLWHSTVAILGK